MRTERPRSIETRQAFLELVSDSLIELRFKAEVKLDAAGLGEVVLAKQALCALRPVDVLAVLPPEIDFELNVLSMDHHEAHGGCGLARRLALAAQSPFNERLANIYFRYHPRTHDTAVFLEVSDARAWLTQQLPRPSLS
jgi:hypothetical protein